MPVVALKLVYEITFLNRFSLIFNIPGASNKIVSVLKPNGESVGDRVEKLQSNKDFSKLIGKTSSSKKEDLNLRVVKFDMPQVQRASSNYSRYLPIKINGAYFPISGISELRGKRILSVVVLAPVAQEEENQGEHYDKDVFEAKEIRFLSGEIIKNLIKKPSTENFRKWLELEQKTISDLQSVVLLVTR